VASYPLAVVTSEVVKAPSVVLPPVPERSPAGATTVTSMPGVARSPSTMASIPGAA
jgi:hypothetical protein